MARRLDPEAGPTVLRQLTGLSRPTVYEALAVIQKTGRSFPGRRVKIPAPLLAERTVGAVAKVLYGLLQAIPQRRGQSGSFTHPSLSQFTHLGPNTVKRGIRELTDAGWLQIAQANRLSPVTFTLGSPQQFRSWEELAAAERRLKRAKYAGEAIMQEYLTLLIDSDQFTDNARR